MYWVEGKVTGNKKPEAHGYVLRQNMAEWKTNLDEL